MMTGFERYTKKTRRAVFLEEMERVVPWAKLCAVGGERERGGVLLDRLDTRWEKRSCGGGRKAGAAFDRRRGERGAMREV